MSKLTRSGVAYDLKVSPHILDVIYDGSHSIKFVFSSEFYMNKFEEKLEDNRNEINGKLSKRYGFTITNNKLADIKLYEKVEKKGFLILGKDEVFTSLCNLKLDGVNLISKN